MKTVVGLFDDMADAKRAALDLEAAGIAHDDISLVANNEGGRYASTDTTTGTAEPTVTGHAVGHDAVVGAEVGGVAGLLLGLTGLAIPGLGWIAGAGWLMGMLLGAGTGAVVGGLIGALTHVGVPHEDAAHFTEGVRRGGTLLAVKAADDMAPRVADILGSAGAVNIDERAAEYARTGYVAPAPQTTAYGTGTTGYATGTTGTNYNTTGTNYGTTNSTLDRQGEAVLPVVEEQLEVGKRQAQEGGVRVYSHVVATPVTEQVTLREEHVTVDRRPVNRVATEADLSDLEDRTVEFTEESEVPVVNKSARVVEEVVVGKTATERTETINDTVRRTEVTVDDLPRR